MNTGVVDLEIALRFAEILSILGGGGLVAFRLGKASEKMQAGLDAQALITKAQSKEITELKVEVRTVAGAMVKLAVQEERLNTLDRRYDEIREAILNGLKKDG